MRDFEVPIEKWGGESHRYTHICGFCDVRWHAPTVTDYCFCCGKKSQLKCYGTGPVVLEPVVT